MGFWYDYKWGTLEWLAVLALPVIMLIGILVFEIEQHKKHREKSNG